jgi:hypothetical protein
LGDRVISTVDFGRVPISTKGVVVGLSHPFIEILSDSPIIGGTNLDGRCTEGLGIICEPNTLLNLTKIQFPLQSDSARVERNSRKETNVTANRPGYESGHSQANKLKDRRSREINTKNQNRPSASNLRYANQNSNYVKPGTPPITPNTEEIELALKNVLGLEESNSRTLSPSTPTENVSKNLLKFLHRKESKE